MELKQFIAQSLVEIMGGIKDAQDQLHGKSHARICPALSTAITEGGGQAIIGMSTENRPIALVEYDVAVEVAQGAASGSLGVRMGVLDVSAKKGSRDVKDAARLKFSVPVSYPEIAHQPGGKLL